MFSKPAFKPNEQQLVEIKDLYDEGLSFEAIAARYGYDRHVIKKIVARRGWSRPVLNQWTESRKAEFKRLYDEGLPHSEIAKTLGVTKDACLGLRRRMGLPERTRIKNDVPKRPPPPMIIEPETPRPEHGVLIWDLKPHHCRWPIHGDADEHMIYCGEQKEDGHSYCAEHVALSKPQAHPRSTPEERAAKAKLSNFFLRRMSHVGAG